MTKREIVPNDKAIAMLEIRNGTVHTFRSSPGMLIGADWPKSKIVSEIKKRGVELSGPQASAMHHCLVLFDETGPLFIATRKEALA